MRVIFTGFDPFGKLGKNPSQQAIEALPDSISVRGEKIAPTTAVLPTCCGDAWKILQRTVGRPREPFILILSGLAESRKVISLERFGLNVRQYRIADNAGHTWDEEHLIKTAPEAIRTPVPLMPMVGKLSRKGFACEVSNHAGSFVCNETYFRALHKWGNQENCLGVVFVHFPLPETYIQTRNEKGRVRNSRKSLTTRSKTSVRSRRGEIIEAGITEYAQVLVEIAKLIAEQKQVKKRGKRI